MLNNLLKESMGKSHLIDTSLMIKASSTRACLLSCLCLQMAFNNSCEIQFANANSMLFDTMCHGGCMAGSSCISWPNF